MGICNISIVMNGIKKCSGLCLYCSAASTMNYRAKDNKNTFTFYPKKLKEKILEYCKPQMDIDKANNMATDLNIDIWGGNPLENFEPFKQVVNFCETQLKEFHFINMHTSGNGLELRDRDLVDYLFEHNIKYQLSHDGVGQWIRTGEIDPLTWDKTKDNIAEMAQKGFLDWINCTLSARNPSFFENMEFWNDWRKRIGIFDARPNLTIKLNHIYDGTPPITKKWLGEDKKYIKKGEEVGDLNFHGETLQNYLHEFRKLAIICHTPMIKNNPAFTPYVDYIIGQADRFKYMKNPEEAGSCVAFQRGLKKVNFAIDTKGKYCQCNLIDSDSTVKNAKAAQPEYCRDCKYKNLIECNPCGSENNPEKCEYKWWWAKTLEEMFSVIEIVKSYENMLSTNNSCNCNGESKCECKGEKQEPVFCVKGYKF